MIPQIVRTTRHKLPSRSRIPQSKPAIRTTPSTPSQQNSESAARRAENIEKYRQRAEQGDNLAAINLAWMLGDFHVMAFHVHPIALLREQSDADLIARRAAICRERGMKWEILNIERILRERETFEQTKREAIETGEKRVALVHTGAV